MTISPFPNIKRSQRSESLLELEDLVLAFQAFSPVNEARDSGTLDSRTSTSANTVFSSRSLSGLERPTPIIITPYGVSSPVTPSDRVREKQFMRIDLESPKSLKLPEREVKEEEEIDTKKRGREEYDLDASAVTEVSDLSDRIFSARKIRKIH